MASRKSVIPEEELLETVPEMDDRSMLQEHLDELKENCSKLKLYRKSTDGKFAYLMQYDPTQWDLDAVKDEFGGGTYQVWAYDENKRLKGKYPLQIDMKLKGRIDKVTEIPTTPQVDPMAYINPMLENQKQGADKMMLMMMENSKQNMAMMQGMMQMFCAVIMGQKQESNHKKEIIGNIDELLKLKMLFPDESKTVNMFMKGLEFANSQKSDEKPFWQDMLAGVLPALPAMFAGGKITGPAPQIPTQQTPEEQMKIAKMIKLQEMAQRLQTACRTAETPDTLVNYLIESAEKIQIVDEALDALQDPAWFENLCKLNPEAVKYKEYLFKCHKLILDEYTEEDTDSEEPVSGAKA